ncbi:MAG: glycosyltransferase [Acidobacteria bacterium]|nr:glycosyltransferase [Acidobacteriota bacterium]MCA1651517.1 glycosyltransferase [Acidobacteriota bacterium]
MRRLRILHALHDFLPRHRAGSEIYAFELAREQSRRHDVFVAAAEYDPATPHGTLRWRAFEGLPVIEIVNNWEFQRFDESYRSARINRQLGHVLDAVRPDVLHIHNLLNLSFDLPRLARERGIASVATLHDYTLVCPSGGQRVHVDEAHVCEEIDASRCSRCFGSSPFHAQMLAGRFSRRTSARAAGRAAALLRRRAPGLVQAAARRMDSRVEPGDIRKRLASAMQVFENIDLCIAPSAALAAEYTRLGAASDRIRISDYGFRTEPPRPRAGRSGPLRIGFVGTLVWHKGLHILLQAVRRLSGAFELCVHGDPSVFPAYAADLRQLAAGLPVQFAGGFEPSRAAEVYGGLDVLVVPSLWPENSPLVIHEAFIHGTAVVAARIGGIPGLVTDRHNGLLYDAPSPESLARALQQLIDDPTLVVRLAAKAPAVKTIDEDACQWDERYCEVINPAAAGLPR